MKTLKENSGHSSTILGFSVIKYELGEYFLLFVPQEMTTENIWIILVLFIVTFLQPRFVELGCSEWAP
jgi:hypothetical protein